MRLHRRLHQDQRQLSHLIAIALVLALACSGSRADERSEVLDVIAPLADALTNGDALAFLKPIDRDMEGFAQLRDNVLALLAEAEVASSVDLISVDNGL